MAAAQTLTETEAICAAAILLAALALKPFYAFHMMFNTDEPQHLHVAWAWTQGLVQYRDLFDNHTPLFHLLAAPIVAAFGERPDLLVWMRLAMIPLWLLSLWAVYRIGVSLFSTRVAVWAAALAAVTPSAFLTSLEFRADDLWAALWFLTLAVLLGGSLGRGRAQAAGCLLGATFATSLKTTVLFGAFAAACALVVALDPATRSAVRSRRFWLSASCLFAGSLVVPMVLVLLFAMLNALPEFFACALVHNFGGASLWRDKSLRILLFVVTLPAFLYAARAILNQAPSASLGRRRAVLLLATALYCTGVNAFWPLIPRQDFLPFYPLAALLLVPLAHEIESRGRRLLPRAIPAGPAVLAAIALVEIGLTLWLVPPWRDRTEFKIGMVADVLRLTRPDEPVMDLKGESLFRRRPVTLVLENITEERIRRGEIHDDIAERLVATRTYVSTVDSSKFPPDARRFLLDNYVPVAHLRVAGKLLEPNADGSAAIDFEVALPGPYTVLSPGGEAPGVLDGVALSGPRFLGAGHHRFEPSSQAASVALVWARAAEQGYSPFHPESP